MNNAVEGRTRGTVDLDVPPNSSSNIQTMIDDVNRALNKWEANTNNLLDSKRQVLQFLREETHKIILLASLWSAKTESVVETLFAEDVKELVETFATCQTLMSALQQQMLSNGNDSRPEQHLGDRVEHVGKLIDRHTLRRQNERAFVINPINQMVAFACFDQLTGICSQLEGKRLAPVSEITKLKSTKVHGRFYIASKAGRNLRLSDSDLCDGILVVSDIMNSCIYVYNSWTGRQVTSTHDNPFQHGVQFPKQVIATSTGQICVTEQLKDTVTRSIFQKKLLNKRLLSKSKFMDETQLISHEIIGFEHLSEPSFERYRSQTKEDTELFTPPSKNDLMIDLIKGKNADVRLQNLTERKNYLLAVNYHRNKVFYVDKRSGSFWTASLTLDCGPRKATLGFSGEILICCAKAIHIHLLDSEGSALRTISLDKTGIKRPISAHQRDEHHLLITEEHGTCTTLTFF